MSMKTPILETDRLILRPFCLEDTQEAFECWESDPGVAKYMFWTNHNDINKTLGWVKKELSKIGDDDWYRWTILSKQTGELFGTGLIYVEEEYGKFDKEELGIKEIMGRHAKENPAFGKVMENLGFTYIKDIPYECNLGKDLYEGKEYILKL